MSCEADADDEALRMLAWPCWYGCCWWRHPVRDDDRCTDAVDAVTMRPFEETAMERTKVSQAVSLPAIIIIIIIIIIV